MLSLLAVVVRSAAAVLGWQRRAKGQVPGVHAAALRHEPLVIVYRLSWLAQMCVWSTARTARRERNPAFVARHREIVALLEQAGEPHHLDEPHTSDLIDCMNSVHALIADRSGVLSDSLASDKPYFVVNASGLSDDDFRAAYTAVQGAYLLGSGGTGLDAALADARGRDTRHDERRATRTALLGRR